jgi:hypothetical protein
LRLFHLTWDHLVDSVLSRGLIPSFRPNKWAIKEARERSCGKVFLCEEQRKAYWYDVYAGEWAGWPPEAQDLVWLEVNVVGLAVAPDQSTERDDYTGRLLHDRTNPRGPH